MPKVTHKFPGLLACLLWAACLPGIAQSSQPAESGGRAGPAETLYDQLRTVGLDGSRLYSIRDASLDRAALHVSLNDGTIAFTKDVAGRITGAYFEGDGEVLLIPPDEVERSSMTLFTGAAILEEKFAGAYLRFNDDTFQELQPFLRPAEGAEDFIVRWDTAARDLAQADAMRLLTTFSRFLPTGKRAAAVSESDRLDANDRLLHLRVQGRRLGIFDVFFDRDAGEQISAGQLRQVGGNDYYDVWTSFAIKREPQASSMAEIAGEEEDHGEIKISSYAINASIDLPTQLKAEARVDMKVLRGGARTVLFELSRFLRVEKVEADGHPLEFIHNQSLQGRELARRGNDLVALIFPEPLRAGQSIELRFSYGGAVLSIAGGGLLYVGARGTWYPNRGFDKATFDMEFRYPMGWTLVATGTKQDDSTAQAKAARGDAATVLGTQVSRWKAERPIPVAGFNLGKYSRIAKNTGTVAVNVYAASSMENNFPEAKEEVIIPHPRLFREPPQIELPPLPVSPANNAESVARNAVRAISFFSSRFGPYPYHELAVTQMPGSLSQGWPGLIFLSSFSFLSPGQRLDLHLSPLQGIISGSVIDHEIAHEWWGDLVTWSGYRDQWISEGLANYSSLMLLESENPAQFRAVMTKYRDDLLRKDKDKDDKNKNNKEKDEFTLIDAGPVTLGSRLSSSKAPDGYETIAYERGTWLFHMLRAIMSRSQGAGTAENPADDPFLLVLRNLAEQHQGRPISTAELMHLFEQRLPASSSFEGRKSLDWFYQGWVNGTAIPTLELHNVKYADKAGATTVTGVIKQKDAPGSLITLVPLYALVSGRNVLIGKVFADGPETQFHLTTPAGTRKILLDPDQTVLSRTH